MNVCIDNSGSMKKCCVTFVRRFHPLRLLCLSMMEIMLTSCQCDYNYRNGVKGWLVVTPAGYWNGNAPVIRDMTKEDINSFK